MTRGKVVSLMLLTALGAVLFGVSALADTVMQGRVSFADQSGLVKGKDDSDWSYASLNSLVMPGDTVWADDKSALEIEFSGGVFLRLADGSRLDVMEVPPSALFRGTTGSFYVQRVRRSNGDVSFDTPVGAVAVSPDSQIRVDILEEGATTVTVRWGSATIHAEGGEPVTLHAGERSFIDPGYLPSAPVVFDRSQEDAFDTWNRSRARDLAEGSVPTPIQSSYAGGEAPIGVSDLKGRGEWVSIDNAPYWHPTAVGYVPYQYGYWSYVPVQGYVWVDNYPWAYVTTHYGHWRYDAGYGWCWGYYGAYRPAYAYTVHYGNSFIWAPLSVYGYPVCYDTYASFSIGDVRFSYGFSSYAYDYAVFGGYHSVFIVDYHHIYDDHHHHHFNDCDYWRIDADASPYKNAGRPHWPSDRVRTFAPDRVYRGATVASDGSTRAVDRATALQARQHATRPIGATPVFRTARTAGATPSAPGVRRADLRRVSLTNPSATRTARGPDSTRFGQGTPGVRTYSNDQARGAAPLNRASGVDRPSVPSERAGISSPSRAQQLAPSGSPERGRLAPRENATRPFPATTRPARPNDAAPPAAAQDSPVERPRQQTTRPDVSLPEHSVERPVPGGNRTFSSEGPRPATTRPQIAETPRPQVIRPTPPDRQVETVPRQQFSRPSYDAPARQQYSRPEAPQPQVSRPEPQRPVYESGRRQEVVRPAPQFTPQPQPQPAPGPQPQQQFRPSASEPSGRTFNAPSGVTGGGANAAPSAGRSGDTSGRSRDRS